MALTQGVGNLKCQSKFGNLLTDSPDEIMRQNRVTDTAKNLQNIKNGKPGTPEIVVILASRLMWALTFHDIKQTKEKF